MPAVAEAVWIVDERHQRLGQPRTDTRNALEPGHLLLALSKLMQRGFSLLDSLVDVVQGPQL